MSRLALVPCVPLIGFVAAGLAVAYVLALLTGAVSELVRR